MKLEFKRVLMNLNRNQKGVRMVRMKERTIKGIRAKLEQTLLDNIIFDNAEDLEVGKEIFQSLARGKHVNLVIMQLWSRWLNYKETLKSESSERRFFASPKVTDYAMHRNYTKFCEQLLGEIICHQEEELDLIDQFVFPVYIGQRHFMVMFETKKPKVHVIDSLNDDKSRCSKLKYLDWTNRLRELLRLFLLDQDLEMKDVVVQGSPLNVVLVKWGDPKNVKDIGIYTMRHMETFMGDSGTWRCGLTKNSKNQIPILRVRYCTALLTWPHNQISEQTVQAAEVHYEKMIVGRNIDVGKKLLG